MKKTLAYLLIDRATGRATSVLPLNTEPHALNEKMQKHQVLLLPVVDARRLLGSKLSITEEVPDPDPSFWSPQNPSCVVRCIRAGGAGSRREIRKYGERLVCVRYRQTETGRLKTVELIETIPPEFRVSTS